MSKRRDWNSQMIWLSVNHKYLMMLLKLLGICQNWIWDRDRMLIDKSIFKIYLSLTRLQVEFLGYLTALTIVLEIPMNNNQKMNWKWKTKWLFLVMHLKNKMKKSMRSQFRRMGCKWKTRTEAKVFLRITINIINPKSH